jgi:4-amino-4-deoxy-L-arabinose transferase-like glycosyltransferase
VPSPRFHGWIIAAAATVVLLVRLGGPALWDDDEPKNAACSLAMLDANDWVVPRFNGRLRVEKPPLVNWIQIGGFSLCGRNEMGARIGSALLTIGTCLLTWQIGCLLVGPTAGLLGGLVMATCVWTAVGGRAATPDAPLLFFTTLAFFLFVRGIGPRNGSAPSGLNGGVCSLSFPSAIGIGAACGAATLAKGPIGVGLPMLAFLLFAASRNRSSAASGWPATLAGMRPLTMLLAAAAVAVPWYVWVGLRTDGEWLRGFLLVHNVGRFAVAMEGHSGSFLYYPAVVAVGLFPWSIVLAAMLAHAACILRSPTADDRRGPLQLLLCWMLAWIGVFSCAGTKLPGYIWPAYPALAIATGLFLADWAGGRVDFRAPQFLGRFPQRLLNPQADHGPDQTVGLVMRLAWSILAATGVAIAIGLPLASGRLAAGGVWLGVLGLIPLAAAAVAWQSQSAGHRQRSLAAVAVGACLLVSLMASVAGESFSDAQGSRALVEQLEQPARECRWACLWNVPPSLVFYTGATIEKLDTAADVAAHLRQHPRSRVVIDGRQEALVATALPFGYGVLARVPTLSRHEYLLLGRLPGHEAPLALAD